MCQVYRSISNFLSNFSDLTGLSRSKCRAHFIMSTSETLYLYNSGFCVLRVSLYRFNAGVCETTTNVDKQPDDTEEKIFRPSGMDIDDIPLSSSQETSSSSDFGTFILATFVMIW